MTRFKSCFIILLATLAISTSYCSKVEKTGEKKQLKDHIKVLIPCNTLESVGFGHFTSDFFTLLVKGNDLYVLNLKDHLLVKFREGKPIKVFQALSGQGPKAFITCQWLFEFDSRSIGVFDSTKKSVSVFDFDLNYKREFRINQTFDWVTRTGNGFAALLNTYLKDDIFALLDNNFNITETFVKVDKSMPFKNFWGRLEKGIYLRGSLAARTGGLFIHSTCKADIFSLDTKKIIATLEWDNPYGEMTQKIIDSRSNLYFSNYLEKQNGYYVIQNVKCKSYTDYIFDLLILDAGGKLVYRSKFPYSFLWFTTDKDDMTVYFFVDNDSLCCIDLKEVL